jgi:hypothetical protein
VLLSSWPPQHEKPTPLGQEVDRAARYWHVSLGHAGEDDALSMERGRVDPETSQHTMLSRFAPKKLILVTA